MKVDDGTGEISSGRWPTAIETNGISRKRRSPGGSRVRSRRGPYCTEDGKDNITLSEGRDPTSTEFSEAVSDGACPQEPITPIGKKSREGQRRLYRRAKQKKSSETGLMWQAVRGIIRWNCASYRKKVVGEPDEEKPHVRFEVAGNGNQDMVKILRHSHKKWRATGLSYLSPRRHSLTLPPDVWDVRHLHAFFPGLSARTDWIRVYTALKPSLVPP